jgi:hypothetical protein
MSSRPDSVGVYAYQTEEAFPKQSVGSSAAAVARETSSVLAYGVDPICVAASKSSPATGGSGVVSCNER